MVLICGEFGVGKEVFVNYIYQYLVRVYVFFVKVNCVVFLEQFFESEFFGFEQGVFIGVMIVC